jgi:RNA-splicing ligase RtcB
MQAKGAADQGEEGGREASCADAKSLAVVPGEMGAESIRVVKVRQAYFVTVACVVCSPGRMSSRRACVTAMMSGRSARLGVCPRGAVGIVV